MGTYDNGRYALPYRGVNQLALQSIAGCCAHMLKKIEGAPLPPKRPPWGSIKKPALSGRWPVLIALPLYPSSPED